MSQRGAHVIFFLFPSFIDFVKNMTSCELYVSSFNICVV